MSTKINVRSPFYLEVVEPDEPQVELGCDLVNLNGMSIDEQGIITLPSLDYGIIDSYTSTDSDFSNNKFDTVSTDTLRTVSFNILVPEGFSNYGSVAYITCETTATQPEFVCTGGVTLNGSIPNQTIAAGGNTATINLSSYFTQGVDPISSYSVDNVHPNIVQATISGSTLTLVSQYLGGTITLNVKATDGDPLTCDAVQPVQITVNSLPTYDCTTANLRGGAIAQDGTITDPLSTGQITAKSLTSGGAHITSVAPNTGSSAIDVTLYFDITVPDGYSNEGATVICSKAFTQQAPATLPTFNCSTAGLTGQSIYQSGAILQGSARLGTIVSFSPTSFPVVYSTTSRTVTFYITPPSSGYSNSGGSNIACTVQLNQPAAVTPTLGEVKWYASLTEFTSYSDMVNNGTSGGSKRNWKQFYNPVSLVSDNPADWVDTALGLVFNDGKSNQSYVVNNWGNIFLPIYKAKGYRQANLYYVLEVRNTTIIGVWQWNNNFYSSGYQTLIQLY